ncbi:MAG: DNA-binding protein [Candidatus Nitrosocaldaceae archaeon]
MSRDESEKVRETELQMLKERMLRTLLSLEARQRLSNIKMVKPELARTVEDYIIAMASQGRIKGELSDEDLKKILIALQKPKRDFRISYR